MTTRPGTDPPAASGEHPEPTSKAATVRLAPSESRPADPTRHLTMGDSAPDRESRGPGIRIRIFAANALLVLFTLGSSIALATWRANVIADRTIRADLAKVPEVFAFYRGHVEDELVHWLSSVAEEPGTKSLFASTDAATRTEWARDLAGLHQARTVFLFDRDGVLLARSDQPAGAGEGTPFGAVRWVAEPLARHQTATAAIREKDVLSIVAAAPVVSGQGESAVVHGVLAASVALDERRAHEVQELTRGEVAFVADVARRGEPPKLVVASASSGFQAAGFLAAVDGAPGAGASLLAAAPGAAAADLTIAGDRRIVRAVPIASASSEVLGACVVSRSRAEETAAFREIRNSLLALGAVALVLAIPFSFQLGRGLARPIEKLAAAAKEIRDGNLDVELSPAGAGEVGALSRAFADMVGELREKAALEALLAELRGGAAVPSAGGFSRRPTTGPIAADARTPRVGERFSDRYDIVGTLGAGGMGSVFRAYDRELEDEIALKVLLPEAFQAGHVSDETLKQEIRLARKITHPNVIRTHDLGEWSGVRFLTMEYVPGTTLREMLDRLGMLAIAPGIQIAKQLCRGLIAVHEAGIVHRDIKPQNIMVLPNGVVKLMDFGISRKATGRDALTEGAVVGTPAYMSPEQARGRAVDARSDLYAVGIVMFEMFVAVRPFIGRTPLETVERALTEAPPRPSKIRPDLPQPLESLILSCIAKDAAERPQSASELYRELKLVVAG